MYDYEKKVLAIKLIAETLNPMSLKQVIRWLEFLRDEKIRLSEKEEMT